MGRRKERAFRLIGSVVAMTAVSIVALPTKAIANPVTYQVVTNEIAAKQGDGSSIEVYRFDPAVYVANQGDDVTLKFRGLKGHDHPIVLEGYNLQAVVRRNQTATLQFHAQKAGFFRLICTAHSDVAHNGPMEAYVVIIPSK